VELMMVMPYLPLSYQLKHVKIKILNILGALLSLKVLNSLKLILIADEESNGTDLPYYFELLKPRLGDVNVIICLDSGCADYERLWLTSSLRGVLEANINVKYIMIIYNKEY
jgi:hypothetical protein